MPPPTLCDLARELSMTESSLESVIKKAGIPCDSEFNGNFIWLTDTACVSQKLLILLHTNSFGEFPVVSLPSVNMLESSRVMGEIVNAFGIGTITREVLKAIPNIPKPALSNSELFMVVQFLTCLWVDIKQEIYRHRYIYWNPLVSFDTPVYTRSGSIKEWIPDCNILRANIWELVDSIYKFLLWSFDDYSYKGLRYTSTKFPMTLSTKEDILKMPGVACLNTPGCKRVAFNMLTLIRSLTAQMCCMLLRRGNDAFVIKPTTEATLADDIKQFYLLIQKMEAFINNG